MKASLNPYLSFRGNAREVLEFYQSVFGGELDISTFGDMHADDDQTPADQVMHGMLTADNGLCIMASDAPMRVDMTPGDNITLSLSGDDEPLLSNYFEKLSAGGKVTMPLEKAMWGDTSGMCAD